MNTSIAEGQSKLHNEGHLGHSVARSTERIMGHFLMPEAPVLKATSTCPDIAGTTLRTMQMASHVHYFTPVISNPPSFLLKLSSITTPDRYNQRRTT
jgi:hypothetical protein